RHRPVVEARVGVAGGTAVVEAGERERDEGGDADGQHGDDAEAPPRGPQGDELDPLRAQDSTRGELCVLESRRCGRPCLCRRAHAGAPPAWYSTSSWVRAM